MHSITAIQINIRLWRCLTHISIWSGVVCYFSKVLILRNDITVNLDQHVIQRDYHAAEYSPRAFLIELQTSVHLRCSRQRRRGAVSTWYVRAHVTQRCCRWYLSALSAWDCKNNTYPHLCLQSEEPTRALTCGGAHLLDNITRADVLHEDKKAFIWWQIVISTPVNLFYNSLEPFIPG